MCVKIACVGYREWAIKIYKNIMDEFDYEYLLIDSKENYSNDKIIKFNPDYVLFYGWSWMISKTIYENYKSIMLHPAPLPKYRGGTPIQNQIIRGEKISAVTLFFINGEIDAGDIIGQQEISLEGHLNQIFERIISVGVELTRKIFLNNYNVVKQNEAEYSIFKRIKPEESEITINEIIYKDSTYLYNKIRMLEDPYPNAYFKTIDGKKISIKLAELDDLQ